MKEEASPGSCSLDLNCLASPSCLKRLQVPAPPLGGGLSTGFTGSFISELSQDGGSASNCHYMGSFFSVRVLIVDDLIQRVQMKTDGFGGRLLSLVIFTFSHRCLVRFCQSCLQECLRPQKPVCAVCRAGLGHWTKAAELEALIQSSVASCKGCGTQVWHCKS